MTKVLLLGSSGLIGSAILRLLKNQRITVICPSSKEIDFINPNLDKFYALLQDITVIINAVGLMRYDKNLMEIVHHKTPALFAKIAQSYATKNHRVLQWINISALGADENSDIAFVASKGRGDKAILYLANSYFCVHIVRPSLVYDCRGASTKFFLQLAKLPILFLPQGGSFMIQPVHNNDVACGIIKLILLHNSNNIAINQFSIIAFVGSNQLTLKRYLEILRYNHYQKRPPIIISVPILIVQWVIYIFQIINRVIGVMNINIDSLTLLQQGNAANNQDFIQLLGRNPIGFNQFDV